jgi:hypothetical protein
MHTVTQLLARRLVTAPCQHIAHLLEALIIWVLLPQLAKRALQALPGSGLAAACLAHHHVAVACNLAVKDLHDLRDKFRHRLQGQMAVAAEQRQHMTQ